MKSKRNLIISIFQLVVGLLAIGVFFVAICNGENITKWLITLILAVAFVVIGIIGIVDYKSKK